MKTIQVMNSGVTRRLHIHNVIKEQNIAEHSWGVATLLFELLKDNKELLSVDLMKAALLHDSAESIIGDIPYFTKKSISSIETIEDKANEELGLSDLYSNLSAEQLFVLKIADMLELAFFCHREIKMGNAYVKNVFNNASEQLTKMINSRENSYKNIVLDLMNSLTKE